MAHLYFVMKNPSVPDRILIWDTRTISIGRSEENDLSLDDDEVSRKHAHLSIEDGEFLIGDYRTGNGTFVNGKRVSQSKKIKPGDVIGIGKMEMEFIQGADHPAGLGLKVDFASHLKTMGMIPQGQDADATLLGMADAAEGDDFVIEPERGSGEVAFMVGGPTDDPAFQMRELDDSLNDMQFELNEADAAESHPPIEPPPETLPLILELDDEPAAAPAPAPTQPRPTAAAPQAAASPDPGSSGANQDPTARLRKLKMLHDEGLITDAEFQAKKAAIIEAM